MTPKQQRFVEEYLIDLNATAAARRAGYSARTADRTGPELLGKPCIASAIAERIEKRSKETAIDAAWVLKEAQAVYLEARKVGRLPDALKALEIVGRHIDVQAFRDQIDHRLVMTTEEARRIVVANLPKYGARLLAVDRSNEGAVMKRARKVSRGRPQEDEAGIL